MKPNQPAWLIARTAKIVATKLAKRITLKCHQCGKEWKEKPSHHWRKFCSYKCGGIAKRKAMEKKCLECGSVFQTTSLNRKKTLCSARCVRQWLDRKRKQRGMNPRDYADPVKWLASVTSKEYREKASRVHTGAVMKTKRSRRLSPDHAHAVEAFVRSPMNVIYHVRNITRFVTLNQGLFLPETVKWENRGKHGSSRSCLAVHGLAQIIRGVRGSWHGWTAVGKREGRERFDLIGRNLKTPVVRRGRSS